ncbi:MAG: protoporphyrinogen oxidase [Bacteroidales bacterium]|nr:protoporphyrinogen oxidase [Bacteroidales bacterium]MBN2821522.1 protoporphyrinogen oxidase [Bacteroidales bacterium]
MGLEKIDAVVLGAGLTGLTAAYYLKKAGKKVLVLEKENRPGGVINSIKKSGFLYETGPNTGIIASPELVALFDDLKDIVSVEIANPNANNRWVMKNGKWKTLPSGFMTAIGTPLFSCCDKFRILGEPFRKPGTDPNESVADMVIRRMGKSYLDYAVDPFISGIYAGDPNLLITKYALPKLYNLEQKYGSFIKGSIKKKKEPKTDLEKRISREVFSIAGGLSKLTDAIANEVGNEKLFTGVKNLKVTPNDDQYKLCFTLSGENIQIMSRHVVSTFGGKVLSEIFPFIDPNELQPVLDLRYAKVAQVIAGYNSWQGIKLNAFGALIPSKESKISLGILFPSSIFSNRAPEKGALLSVFMGGIRRPELLENPDKKLKEMALKEIRETLKTTLMPDLLEVYRYPAAIPQYEISSGRRYEAIAGIERKHPGLILAGNIRDGIGMADRVKQGRQIAEKFLL